MYSNLLKRKAKIVTALLLVLALVVSAFTIMAASTQPFIVSPESQSSFQHYVNETLPTGWGTFNTSILGSNAEIAYTYSVSTNGTTIKAGYVMGIQVTFSIVKENLGIGARGFSMKISKAYENFGTQHYHYGTTYSNFSGNISFARSTVLISPGNHVLLYQLDQAFSPQTVQSTFNLSFQIVPMVLAGPYYLDGPPVTVSKILESSK